MDLGAYLDRIGFGGAPRVDRDTLGRLQRLHMMAIPYENLDVLLGRRVTTDPAAAFEKLVRRRRGGWCYEMNGLFGWALAAIGFPVTRLASGVMRLAQGDANIGNHLVLLVSLDGEALLADVGLGDGPTQPFPLAETAFTANGHPYRVEAIEGGWWRLHNRPGAMPTDFDLHTGLADESILTRMCETLQSDPQSIFVQNLICQRLTQEGIVQLVGRTLRRESADGWREHLIGSADELVDTLGEAFGIDEPAAAGLWPRLCARHEERLAAG